MKKIILSLICFTLFFGTAFGQTASSSGTGFFITNNGVIVTCAHVIEGVNRITVKINNTEYPAEIIRVNDETDLAILKINFNNPYHFKIVNFDTLNLGDRLSVLGFPLPDYLTSDIRFTEGSLSAKSGLKSATTYFQHSAPTQPGNSGGPILNSRYEVIGVAAAIINDAIIQSETGTIPQNINFGIKSNFITPLLNNIRPGSGNIRTVADAERATVQILCYQTRTTSIAGIKVINNTGYQGYNLFIRAAGTNQWGIDLLGNEYLRNGHSFSISSLPSSRSNRYDIRLIDTDRDSYTKLNIAINPNTNIIFTFDDFDKDITAAESNEGPPVTIVNNTGSHIFYVYISPTSSDRWGYDRLNSNQTLQNGQTVSLRLPYALNVTDKYDIMLEDSEGVTFTKFNVTVKANGRITFTRSDLDR